MPEEMTVKQIAALIEWFRLNGMTDEQAAECIRYIAATGK